jgi:hypothetical protein
MGSLFSDAINDHLELRRRNARLEPELPLSRYLPEEIGNHSLFRPEAEARLDDTQEFAPHWPLRDEDAVDAWLVREPPSFDWGD